MKQGLRVLVTGAGGIAGVNFVRALRASRSTPYVVGTEYNRYYINFPDLEKRYRTPRHSDPAFIEKVSSIVEEDRIEFVHPQPSSEALVIAQNREKIGATTFLPNSKVMEIGQDKLTTQEFLEGAGVPVAKTWHPKAPGEVSEAFKKMGAPLWVRARHGAGGRLSLLCDTPEEAEYWIKLWVTKGTSSDEFIVQEYLPGRNIAWDSIWKDGKLVTSYCRERLEYPLKHVSPSGITGTPSVARTVSDPEVNKVSVQAVLAVDPKPNGVYSVDLKDGQDGRPRITEVDAGKFHSTMPLWGYVAVTELGLDWYANLPDLYISLGTGEDVDGVPQFDLIPAGYYMLRNIDCGVMLWKENGWKKRVL
ncbi:MAG: hypothetical protein QXI37_03815 [Thermoprotei archaeon]